MKKIITFFSVLFLLCTVKVNSQISTFPYIATGGDITGWTPVQSEFLWYIGAVTKNPSNVSNDTAVICNFYGQPDGVEGMIVSPAFNFTSLSHPVLNFYVAYRTYDSFNDSLQVLISTNGGITFIDTPVPYRKANNSTPSLATLPASNTEFNPSSPSQWRHETIDLAAYAGMNGILIAFRGRSANGNNLWIDDFIINNADDYCTNNVTAPGNYSCNSYLSVNMNTIGDPAGGVLSVTDHLFQDPVPSYAQVEIATNTTATTQDGSIYTPNIIAPDAWFTVSYTGNDKNGYANYNLSIDVSTYISVLDISKLYIMKRSDLTGSWECVNTTISGGLLTANGLTYFSDFGVGGDTLTNPLPVELESFVSVINGSNVDLKWSTSSELNNAGFDIERSANNVWSKVGNVKGNGTSSIINNYFYSDRNLATGSYSYRLKQIDFNGNFKYYNLNNDVNIGAPDKYELSQNYPNPFNPETKISFNLPQDSKVSLKVFDMTGREVSELVNDFKPAGYYSVNFNATSLSSGVYYYSISAGSFISTKKMIVVK
ncbi:MAG TPA: T9SS type A sorting domain-containing protein [Ignavibacteria bacterium]|nr:T9SS type A sorting domain-containing protein [Ignavibacteria bacterium]